MTQEEKQLLLKDLCARLPYGVICRLSVKGANVSITEKLDLGGLEHFIFGTMEIKPYLRPMSSMTDEEKEQLQQFHDIISDENYGDGYSPTAWNEIADFQDYCNVHHLDYRGLIHIGLVLEAPKEMYKNEK